MATDSSNLRARTQEALVVLHQARATLAELGVVSDERPATALPLAMAAMDTAEAIYALLINQPESFWVSALILQRAQMEYTLRAAFFAGPAIARRTWPGRAPEQALDGPGAEPAIPARRAGAA